MTKYVQSRLLQNCRMRKIVFNPFSFADKMWCLCSRHFWKTSMGKKRNCSNKQFLFKPVPTCRGILMHLKQTTSWWTISPFITMCSALFNIFFNELSFIEILPICFEGICFRFFICGKGLTSMFTMFYHSCMKFFTSDVYIAFDYKMII